MTLSVGKESTLKRKEGGMGTKAQPHTRRLRSADVVFMGGGGGDSGSGGVGGGISRIVVFVVI